MNSQLWVPFAFFVAAVITSFIFSFFKFSDPGTTAGDGESVENAAANELHTVNISPPPKAKLHDKLERMVYTTEKSSSDGGCVICLDEYGDGERLATIDACSHRFHALCIEAWLQKNNSCPLCRHVLV